MRLYNDGLWSSKCRKGWKETVIPECRSLPNPLRLTLLLKLGDNIQCLFSHMIDLYSKPSHVAAVRDVCSHGQIPPLHGFNSFRHNRKGIRDGLEIK